MERRRLVGDAEMRRNGDSRAHLAIKDPICLVLGPQIGQEVVVHLLARLAWHRAVEVGLGSLLDVGAEGELRDWGENVS